MWLFIGQSLWFILPAGLANIASSLSRYLPLPQWPVDAGKTWRGRRIFGDHKTWRGMIVGTVTGLATFWLQQYLYQFDFFSTISLTDYSSEPWIFGLLLGAGSVMGDLIKSYFKRRVNIAPGQPWLPFDQIDFVVGALAAVSIVFFPGWGIVIFLLIFGFVLHIAFNLLGYILKLQKNKL
ncbi:CDP-archaeol synthase [Patescibacteria group bacterium]|nr:CDP-archaeol synthase [Patescibacteria group bacterium]